MVNSMTYRKAQSLRGCIQTLLLTLLSGWVSAEQANSLLIGVQTTINEPYWILEDGQPSGIMPKIATALAERLDLELEFLPLPRSRLDQFLLSGEIDAISHFNPNWTRHRYAYQFSEPLYFERNRLVMTQYQAAKVQKLDDLIGMRIGGLAGYSYSTGFNDLVERSLVTRDDTSLVEQNLLKLLTGRIDGFILADVIFNYQQRIDGRYHLLALSPLELSDHSLHWAMPAQHPLAETVFLGLQSLLDDGSIAEIVGQYQ